MLSLKDNGAVRSASYSMALYKGLTVCVYSVDTPELTLTRRDLIDLVNVRVFFIYLLIRTSIGLPIFKRLNSDLVA